MLLIYLYAPHHKGAQVVDAKYGKPISHDVENKKAGHVGPAFAFGCMGKY